MGNLAINGTFTYLPDPTECIPEPVPEVGRFASGKPVRQGPEIVTLKWEALSYTEWDELRSRWSSNNSSAVSCDIPAISGTDPASYRTVTAWLHEPQITSQRDINNYEVEIKLTID